MKKKISVLLCLFMLLVGCGPEVPKADKKLVCLLQSENEGQTLEVKVEISYDSEKGIPTKGIFKTEYDNLERNKTNNMTLNDLVDRQTKLEDLAGVKIDFTGTDTSFNFKETWNYNEVDIKSALEADASQINFIENDMYSINKIKDYYKKLGYSCDVKKIKNAN